MKHIFCIIFLSVSGIAAVKSQAPLNYNSHIVFDGLINPTGLSTWYISANHDSSLSSLLSESISEPVLRDISLTGMPENELWTPIDTGVGPTLHYVFRMHNPQTLEPIHSQTIKARRMQTNPGGNNSDLNLQAYASVSKSEDLTVVHLNMAESSMAQLSENLSFTADVWPKQKNLLIAFDEVMNPLYTREIIHKGSGNFSSSWTNSGLGQVHSHKRINNGAFISDFTFKDSLEVVMNGDTTFHFCAASCIFLEVGTPQGEWYSKIIDDYSGHVQLSESFIHNDHVYRIFVISGEANLSAGDIPSAYSTGDGVYEGILVCYNNEGNVEWVKTICRFESTMPGIIPSMSFQGEISAGKLVVFSRVNTTPQNGVSAGQLTYFANSQEIDTGPMADNNAFLLNRSPYYSLTFDLADGTCDAAMRIRSQPESAGYSHFANQQMYLSLLTPERVSINAAAGHSAFEMGFIADRIYPNFENIINLPLSGEAMPALILSCLAEGLTESEFYKINVTADILGSSLQYITFQKPDGEILLSGRLTRQLALDFANLNIPLTTGMNNNSYTAAVIYASPIDLSSHERTEMNNILLYPNPVEDRLFVSGNDPFYSYTIRDIAGRLVLDGNTDFRNSSVTAEKPIAIQVDVSSLPKGLYIISLHHANTAGQRSIKFVKL